MDLEAEPRRHSVGRWVFLSAHTQTDRHLRDHVREEAFAVAAMHYSLSHEGRKEGRKENGG